VNRVGGAGRQQAAHRVLPLDYDGLNLGIQLVEHLCGASR
jgi:hypothetical protein